MQKIILVATQLLLTATLLISCEKETVKSNSQATTTTMIGGNIKPHLELIWGGKPFQNDSSDYMHIEQYFSKPHTNPITNLYWENYHDSVDLYIWTSGIDSLEESVYEVTVEFGTANGFTIDEAGRGIMTITNLENGYVSGTFSGQVYDLVGESPKSIEGKFENVAMVKKYRY